MSFDPFFCRQNGAFPSIAELKEYFTSLSYFQIQEAADDGVQFWYQNEATGIYCDFSYSPLDVSELEDVRWSNSFCLRILHDQIELPTERFDERHGFVGKEAWPDIVEIEAEAA